MKQSFNLFLWLFPLLGVDGWIPECINNSKQRDLLLHRHLFRQDKEFISRWGWPPIKARRRSLNMNEDDDTEKNKDRVSDGIPQLPPIGSSASSNAVGMADDDNKPFVANHKFQIQYTCNICETRNTNTISRIAYRQGVVIARCKGCQNQHLIADHLGWTDYEGGFQGNTTNTIEDYFANDANNKTNVTVNRVNTDVFELEKILQYDTGKSGAIVSDDGKLALE